MSLRNPCIVPSCKDTDYRLHKLPLDEERGREWLRILEVPGHEDKEYRLLRYYYNICNIHFDDSQFRATDRLLLKSNIAIPSLNPAISYVIPPRTKIPKIYARTKGPSVSHMVKEDGSNVLSTNNKLEEVCKVSQNIFERHGSKEVRARQDHACSPPAGSSTSQCDFAAVQIKTEPEEEEEEDGEIPEPPEQVMLMNSMLKEEPVDVDDHGFTETQASSVFKSDLLETCDETSTSTQSQEPTEEADSSQDGVQVMRRKYGKAKKGGISCSLCYKYFPNQEVHDRHLILDEQVTCKFCLSSFSLFSTLIRHMKRAHSMHQDLPYCKRCKQFFVTTYERDEHFKVCNRCRFFTKLLNRYQCDICSRNFPSKETLTFHLQEKHQFLFKNQNNVCNKEILQSRLFYPTLQSRLTEHPDCYFVVFCSTCNTDITYDEYFTKHYEQCFLKPNFICPFCNVAKKNIHSDMQVHLDKHLTLSNKLSQCDDCKVCFFNCINYFTHNSSVHKESVFSRASHLKANNLIRKSNNESSSKRKSFSNFQIKEYSKSPEISNLENVPTLSIPEIEPRKIKLIDIPEHLNKGKCFSKNVLESVKSVNLKLASDEVVNSEHAYCANNDDTYFCSKCDDEISKSQMVRHIALHLYKCPFCTQVFDSANCVRSHMALSTNADTDLYEFLASEAFYEKHKNTFFSRQKRVVYLVERPRLIEYIEENQCKVCNMKFQFHCQLLRHQLSLNHDIDIIQCGVCNVKFCSKFMYDFHLTLHAEEMVSCRMCRINLPTIDSFMEHINSDIHVEDHTFGVECKYCYDMKLNEEKLLKHNEKYHRDNKCWCRICDTKYDTLSLLDAHRAYNHSIMKFNCKKCEAQFSIKQFQNQHAVHCQI